MKKASDVLTSLCAESDSNMEYKALPSVSVQLLTSNDIPKRLSSLSFHSFIPQLKAKHLPGRH